MKRKISIALSVFFLASLSGYFFYKNENTAVSPQTPRTISEDIRLTQSTSSTTSDDTTTNDTVPPSNPPHPKSLIADRRQADSVVAPDGKTYPLRIYKPSLLPNDPQANQWWVGSNTGLSGAWDYGAGSRPTLVAVIDTGYALKHEEFVNRWHLNSGETGSTAAQAASRLNCTGQGLPINQSCNLIDDDYDAVVDNEAGVSSFQNPSKLNCTAQGKSLDKACNNIDDDGNGLVDDVTGWDFANFDHNVQAGEINPAGGVGTTHGTMVSGVLAATGNNGVGIAGVNWTTKILPMQALDDDGYGDTLTVSRAIRYAADQKADVISISLGTDFEDSYLRQAVDYAISKGSVVVAASGNGGCDCISYPARYPEVIAVGASTADGNSPGFSSYGTELDLLAPGLNITTPTWASGNQISAYASGIAGTSFSTPFVSGLLALARSHQPNASWGELTAALLEKSDHRNQTLVSPHSSNIGFGYVRADSLLARVTASARPPVRYQLGPIRPSDTLDTSRSYQCMDGDFPTTQFYELKRGGEIKYTTSKLALFSASQAGWGSRQLSYACVGLPSDQPGSIHQINLLREINSDYDFKRNY